MVPFIAPGPLRIGSISLDWWLLLVVIGIALGTEFARARAIKKGLSVKITVDCTLFMVASGFLVAHFVSVLFYNFERFQENWKIILPWYGGYASIGGFFGAALAIPFFLHIWKKAPSWAYADNLAMGFILGHAIGRFGCFTAHDHIGSLTTFPLAVTFPPDWPRAGVDLGTRHELGLYESVFCFALFALMIFLDRKKDWFHGFFVALMLLAYCPARFVFDFLRAQDLEAVASRASDDRYSGLTPAQFGVMGLFAFGMWIVWYRRDKGHMDLSGEVARDFPGGNIPKPLAEAAAGEAPAEDGTNDAPEEDGAIEAPTDEPAPPSIPQ